MHFKFKSCVVIQLFRLFGHIVVLILHLHVQKTFILKGYVPFRKCLVLVREKEFSFASLASFATKNEDAEKFRRYFSPWLHGVQMKWKQVDIVWSKMFFHCTCILTVHLVVNQCIWPSWLCFHFSLLQYRPCVYYLNDDTQLEIGIEMS